MFPLGLEPRTFRVLGGCDNHYTTETTGEEWASKIFILITFKNGTSFGGDCCIRCMVCLSFSF